MMKLRLPAAVSLLKLAYIISRDPAVISTAIAAASQLNDISAARLLAGRYSDTCGSAAAYAAFLAVTANDVEDASAKLQQAKQLGGDRRGLTELAEFYLAEKRNSPDESHALVSALAQRRDLPMLLSRLIHTTQMWEMMLVGQGEAAAQIARHMLSIEHVGEAEILLWSLAMQKQDASAADRHWNRAHLKPDQTFYYACLATASLGMDDEADRHLADLEDCNADFATRAREIVASIRKGAVVS